MIRGCQLCKWFIEHETKCNHPFRKGKFFVINPTLGCGVGKKKDEEEQENISKALKMNPKEEIAALDKDFQEIIEKLISELGIKVLKEKDSTIPENHHILDISSLSNLVSQLEISFEQIVADEDKKNYIYGILGFGPFNDETKTIKYMEVFWEIPFNIQQIISDIRKIPE